MTLKEKAAYLKGLADGLGKTDDEREGKLWTGLLELLGDMADELHELSFELPDLSYWDEDDEEEEDDDVIDFAPQPYTEDGEEDEPEEDEDGEELSADDFDGVMYDVVCPVCGEELTLDEETLSEGSILCPGCGETLEFDLSEDEDEDGAPED